MEGEGYYLSLMLCYVMNNKNKNLVPRNRGRPKFSRSFGSVKVRSNALVKRGNVMKNVFANLKRSRRGL